MADPKYADLPGIATDQPDTYETFSDRGQDTVIAIPFLDFSVIISVVPPCVAKFLSFLQSPGRLSTGTVRLFFQVGYRYLSVCLLQCLGGKFYFMISFSNAM